MNNWKKGDSEVMSEFPFTGTPGFKVEIQDNTNKHCFLKRFLDEEIIAPLTLQTNKHVVEFIQANANKMLAFTALTYYMGIMKKDLVTSYWSIDSTMATPFPRRFILRNEFEIIFDFLHCCDNSEYATKGQSGYNPKKTLGFTYEKLVEHFCNVWSPHKNTAIDKRTAPFKGRIQFKCYNSKNQTNMGLRPLNYVSRLMHTAMC